MAKEKSDVSSMEVDDQISTNPKFSINGLSLITHKHMYSHAPYAITCEQNLSTCVDDLIEVEILCELR